MHMQSKQRVKRRIPIYVWNTVALTFWFWQRTYEYAVWVRHGTPFVKLAPLYGLNGFAPVGVAIPVRECGSVRIQ
jgi:hypothetical protein